jgi:hypothetical protein
MLSFYTPSKEEILQTVLSSNLFGICYMRQTPIKFNRFLAQVMSLPISRQILLHRANIMCINTRCFLESGFEFEGQY